ncbi:deoxyribodipyrimidine photo-lyase domain protein [Burkholderia pseudomallei]|nr:deoxyribodipyrimidine photo-lyase domain protein [Burkholderia pseudomallei]
MAPRRHAASAAGSSRHGMPSSVWRRLRRGRSGKWCNWVQPNSRQPSSLRNLSRSAWVAAPCAYASAAACQSCRADRLPKRTYGDSRLVDAMPGRSRSAA